MRQIIRRFNGRAPAGLLMLTLAAILPVRVAYGTGFPTDPFFTQQWALREISAPEAWDRAASLLGATPPVPVVVAVIDTGVDAGHPDLTGRVLPGHSFVAGADGTGDDSPEGHGTAVAGMIAAVAGNAVAIAGAAGPLPVMILPLKALEPDASGALDNVTAAIRWALAWQGAAGERVRVINLSLGVRAPEPPPALSDAIAEAQAAGVLVVAAAGNDGGPVAGYYPAALPGVISVGATRPDHTAEPGSGEGALVAAPGAGILTTLPGGAYGLRSGTSFATPLVSAAAAVLWSVFPGKSRAELIDALLGGQAELRCNEPGRSHCPVLSLDLALARLAALKAPRLDRPAQQAGLARAGFSGTVAPGATVTIRGSYGGAVQTTAGSDGHFGAELDLPGAGAYSFTATAVLGEQASPPSEVVGLVVDLTPPGPPRNLVGAAEGGGGILLQWRAPADADVTGYVILRSGAAVPRRTQWLDDLEWGLTPGGTYTVAVASVDRAGNRSAFVRATVTLTRLHRGLR